MQHIPATAAWRTLASSIWIPSPGPVGGVLIGRPLVGHAIDQWCKNCTPLRTDRPNVERSRPHRHRRQKGPPNSRGGPSLPPCCNESPAERQHQQMCTRTTTAHAMAKFKHQPPLPCGPQMRSEELGNFLRRCTPQKSVAPLPWLPRSLALFLPSSRSRSSLPLSSHH